MKFDKTKVKFYAPAPDKGWSEENSVIGKHWYGPNDHKSKLAKDSVGHIWEVYSDGMTHFVKKGNSKYELFRSAFKKGLYVETTGFKRKIG